MADKERTTGAALGQFRPERMNAGNHGSGHAVFGHFSCGWTIEELMWGWILKDD